MRLGDDMGISPFKLSKVECGLIKLQIEFLLDRRVTCNNEMLYHQEIPKGPHHGRRYLGICNVKIASIELFLNFQKDLTLLVSTG